jgi:enoyl-CoA hydratase
MVGQGVTEDVVIAREGAAGRIALNRPKPLHALTEDMCRTMADALLSWREDPAVRLVIIEHLGDRGFCAGGDIRRMGESGYGDGREAAAFFLAEYRLNHLLFGYEKPVVAFMDGVTMGGGAGLAMPSRVRVATERTLFAMPETGIGLFPDVGAGWFLPRLPRRAGWWLALTGARLKADDCRLLDLATHVLDSGRVAAAKRALIDTGDTAVLDRWAAATAPAPLAEHLDEIAECFDAPDVAPGRKPMRPSWPIARLRR